MHRVLWNGTYLPLLIYFVTDSLHQGIDLPNITLVIQWRASCDLCTLWQRFGRAARDFALNAIALFLVEPMYFDETRDEKAARKAKREEKARAKAKAAEADKVRLGKRRRTDGVCQDNHPRSPRLNQPLTAHTNTEPPLISTTVLHAQFMAASFTTVTATCTLQLPPPTANAAQDDASDDDISDDEDARDMVTLWADRRELYHGVGGSNTVSMRKRKRKKDGNELDPAMDDMINAGCPGRCFKCIREPAKLYFDNDTASE